MPKIKLCPFCGSNKVDVCYTAVYWIRCAKCGADGNNGKTKDDAIREWNKRTKKVGFAEIEFDDGDTE
jgi:Lar family restriction alleviation protein